MVADADLLSGDERLAALDTVIDLAAKLAGDKAVKGKPEAALPKKGDAPGPYWRRMVSNMWTSEECGACGGGGVSIANSQLPIANWRLAIGNWKCVLNHASKDAS